MMINCLFFLPLVTAISSSSEIPKTRSINDIPEYSERIDADLANNRTCPDPEIRFYLYTQSNVNERQLIHIDDTWDASNLSSSLFNPLQPSKIIIHGFRSDMFLTPLFEMKTGELRDLIS